MIGIAYDYSAGTPGAAHIKASGALGAIRYIGMPGNRKNTTREELLDFQANRIGMALVHQLNTLDWLGGRSAGARFGQLARDHANAIGFPADRPIYMAIDRDIRAFEIPIVLDYMRGAGEALGGPSLTGTYGEADVIDAVRNAGLAQWHWQTAAWSGGRRTDAHLYQKVGTVYVGPAGSQIACDVNEVHAPDWGQFGDHMTLTDTDKADIRQAVLDALQSVVSTGPDNVDRTFFQKGEQDTLWIADTLNTCKAGFGALSDDEANVLRALLGVRSDVLVAIANIPPGGVPTDEQVDHMVDLLDAALLGNFNVTIERKTPNA